MKICFLARHTFGRFNVAILNNLREKYDDSIKDIIPLKYIEKIYIKKALEIYGDTTEGKKLAAKKLGIGIATLYRKLE